MKTKNLIAGLVIGSLTAGIASGATFRYRESGDWNTITPAGGGAGWGLNPNNGTDAGSLPGGSDDARINWGGNIVTVTSVVPTVNRVQIGVDESGTVVVDNGGILSTAGTNGDLLAGNNNVNATGTLTVNNGGIVNVGRILWAANNSSTGVININSGGVVNVASHLWWGVTGNATINIGGTLNQTGGILGLGTSNASTASGGTATVSVVDGGLFALNNISGSGNSIFAGSVIDFSGTGQMTLPGDFVGVLTNYANANQLSGNGVAGLSNLSIDFDTTNAGFTTVRAIPEPGMISLLGMVGVLGLLRRRRLR